MLRPLDLSLILTLTTVFFISSSCKVESQKNVAEPNSSTIQSTSPKDLAIQSSLQINPDEAIVTILVKDINFVDRVNVISAQVISLNKKSFGFSSIINSGDEIKIININDLSINTGETLNCVIAEVVKPSSNTHLFKLIKLI